MLPKARSQAKMSGKTDTDKDDDFCENCGHRFQSFRSRIAVVVERLIRSHCANAIAVTHHVLILVPRIKSRIL